jgi:hypothetical protein
MLLFSTFGEGSGGSTSEHLSLREQVTFDDDDVRFLFQLMLVHLCNVKMVGIVQSTFLDKLCVLVHMYLHSRLLSSA